MGACVAVTRELAWILAPYSPLWECWRVKWSSCVNTTATWTTFCNSVWFVHFSGTSTHGGHVNKQNIPRSFTRPMFPIWLIHAWCTRDRVSRHRMMFHIRLNWLDLVSGTVLVSFFSAALLPVDHSNTLVEAIELLLLLLHWFFWKQIVKRKRLLLFAKWKWIDSLGSFFSLGLVLESCCTSTGDIRTLCCWLAQLN